MPKSRNRKFRKKWPRKVSREPGGNPVFKAFGRTIHEKYEPVFRDCMALVRIGNELFSRSLSEPLHKVMRFISKIVVNSNGAVLTLVVNGYGNDAMKVARSMFEGAVTAAYLRRHPDLIEDYLHYDPVRRWKLYEVMISDSPEYLDRVPREDVDAMKQEYDKVAPKFAKGKKGKLWDSWRKDVSLYAMAKEVGLGRFYVPFYGTASGIHHVDASGMRGQMSRDVFDVEVAPSDRYVHVALAMSHNLTFRVLYDFNQEAKLEMDGPLEEAKQAQIKAWESIREPQ